jgi:hypothetical protein
MFLLYVDNDNEIVLNGMNLSAVRNAESYAKECLTKYALLARLPFQFTSRWNPDLKLHAYSRDLSSFSYKLKI